VSLLSASQQVQQLLVLGYGLQCLGVGLTFEEPSMFDEGLMTSVGTPLAWLTASEAWRSLSKAWGGLTPVRSTRGLLGLRGLGFLRVAWLVDVYKQSREMPYRLH
jgi:hypothetical protein